MHKLVSESFSGQMHATRSAFMAHMRLVMHYLEKTEEVKKIELPTLLYNGNSDLMPFDKEPQEEVVAIIPYEGLMTKSSWWRFAAEDIAEALHKYYANDAVKGIILKGHSHGGTLDAGIEIENALALRNKPVYGYIDSAANSLGAYNLIAHTDGAFASNKKAQIGSIGVMVSIMDDSKLYEKYGITYKEIYPPESKFKNKAVRDVIEKNDDTDLIKEYLSPLAVGFQDAIKAARPKLDLSIEGIIEGKIFFASDAEKYGLIDGIMSLPQMIDFVFKQSNKNNKKKSEINRIIT